MRYRTRPITVSAYQTTTDTEINNIGGTLYAAAGDWIITGPDGDRFPLKADIFAMTYQKMIELTKGETDHAD